MTIYSEKQNQILENQCEALQVQETYLSTCEPNSCASLPSEKRFGGLLPAGLGSQAAGHSTTSLYHALGHQSGLSQCFPVSREGGCEGKKEELQTHFHGPGRCNVWVNMGHDWFPFPEADLCFQAPVNTNKQNTASVSTRQQYHPFCGYRPEGRWLRVTS